MNRVLLAVNVQRQFKDRHGKYKECLKYIRERKHEYDQIICSIFSQSIDGVKNNNYIDYLGWDKCLGCDERDIEYKPTCIIHTNTYSVNITGLLCEQRLSLDDSVDIIGANADTDIMATCFALWDKRMHFNILDKYIYTSFGRIRRDTIRDMMRRNFGTALVM